MRSSLSLFVSASLLLAAAPALAADEATVDTTSETTQSGSVISAPVPAKTVDAPSARARRIRYQSKLNSSRTLMRAEKRAGDFKEAVKRRAQVTDRKIERDSRVKLFEDRLEVSPINFDRRGEGMLPEMKAEAAAVGRMRLFVK